jgi:hypothetical protein
VPVNPSPTARSLSNNSRRPSRCEYVGLSTLTYGTLSEAYQAMLADDALKVLLADQMEQVDTAGFDMTRVQDPRLIAHHVLQDETGCQPAER